MEQLDELLLAFLGKGRIVWIILIVLFAGSLAWAIILTVRTIKSRMGEY